MTANSNRSVIPMTRSVQESRDAQKELAALKKRRRRGTVTKRDRAPCPNGCGVYFIQQGSDGPVKIGYAPDVETRISQLQVGNPEDLRLIGWVSGATEADEKALHQTFSLHRIRGEWFWPTRKLLSMAISSTEDSTRARLPHSEDG